CSFSLPLLTPPRATLFPYTTLFRSEVVSPWHAALASAVAFLAGSVLPMLAILLPPASIRVPVTFVAVLVALAITGAVGAWIGRADPLRAALRVVIGGALALAATFAVGSWLGASGMLG